MEGGDQVNICKCTMGILYMHMHMCIWLSIYIHTHTMYLCICLYIYIYKHLFLYRNISFCTEISLWEKLLNRCQNKCKIWTNHLHTCLWQKRLNFKIHTVPNSVACRMAFRGRQRWKGNSAFPVYTTSVLSWITGQQNLFSVTASLIPHQLDEKFS